MAYDAFLKLDGVTGESQKDKHKGEIEIHSFSWGASNPTTVGKGTGMAAGKVSFADFSVMKVTDKSSATLFANCCSGNHFPKAWVYIQKATGGTSGETYLEYDFKNVFVTSIQWSGSSGGDESPTESVSFSYEQVQVIYKAQEAGGKLGAQVIAGWNQATNSKV
jgi:type VI secretion system secreted protein Hcp